ncbi:MAG: 16S rRNA (uracil(1498)-N(3))-methyltransferase [Pseudomonadota bacterium]
MRVPRVYTELDLVVDAQVELESGPSQHLARALRMGPGDSLTLFNGSGGEYAASITAVSKQTVTVRVDAFRSKEVESSLGIELGIAVSRGERMDWIIQKSTELGVASIAPLFTERTEVKLKGERASKKLSHWQQIAVSACEQCGRNRVPTVADFSPLGDWLSATSAERKFVLHHRSEPQAPGDTPGSVALLIGPEGGLSPGEIEAALAAGFEALRLGPRVLRTETAPLAALSILQARWGDMA